jgi:multisubunit Na+/H+ antiporter MnhC subunit
MIRTFISLGVAFLVAVLVYLALPNEMYVEKAGNIIVLAFIGAAVITWLMLMRKRRQSTQSPRR